MNKAKCLLLAVAAAAMAFTVSCSSDGGSENIGTCGGREYDTRLGYSCVNGELVGSCRGKDYYPEYEHCENGEVKEGTAISSSSGGGGSSPSGGGNTFADSRDGKTYKTVKIGTQTWMAENLNYNASGSKCFGEGGQVVTGLICADDEYLQQNCTPITKTLSPSEVQANCTKYGRLYDWQTALTVCPSGWRLPSNDDWDELLRYVDTQNGGEGNDGTPYDSYTAGKYLKATSGWNWNDYDNISGNGTDKYGFSALPGGGGYLDGYFVDIGDIGRWWSSSEYSNSHAYYRDMARSAEYAYFVTNAKLVFLSVRCLQGNPSSSSGGGGSSSSGGNTQEKTLAITMPSDIFSNTADFGVYIVPVGTTLETLYQSAEDIIIAVGGNMLNLDWSYSGTTASFPLYKFKFDGGGITDGRWTGSGTYNVFVVFENDIGSYIYLKESVNLSSATTNIQINSGNLVSSTEGGVPTPAKTQFTDSRDSKTYNKVTIGTQVWMAENLNYAAEGSKCFGEGGPSYIWDESTEDYIEKTLSPAEIQANCNTYGRLYNWATAMGLPSSCNSNSCSGQIGSPHRGICPAGWHIPSDNDWDVLMSGSSTAGRKLKATSGWYNCGPSGSGSSYVCEDAYGFSALPGGIGGSDGSFYYVGINGSWWSASELGSSNAYNWGMSYDYERAYRDYYDFKSHLFSVRCLQD